MAIKVNHSTLPGLLSASDPFLFILQEGSGHEDGEDADGEDEDFELEGDETSDESDSEELDEKGRKKTPTNAER